MSEQLPESIDRANVSEVAKVPFKLLGWRGAIIWRSEELGRSACDLYERNDLGAAIVLTRALTENAAVIWHVQEQIDKYVRGHCSKDDMVRLDRLLFGFKNQPQSEGLPTPPNVLKFLDKFDKIVPGFRSQYDQLCEVTHPNWSGVLGLYSLLNCATYRFEFGKAHSLREHPAMIGLLSLRGSLELIAHAHEKIDDRMPDSSRHVRLKSEMDTDVVKVCHVQYL